MPSPTISITSAEQACEVVRSNPRISIRGGDSKPALRFPDPDATCLEMRGLTGMIEYEPDEYVFTAFAGTPLAEVMQTLDRAGQYLPFDPLFAEKGSTLGGCIASGISGPGRLRYGGLRDFVIGLRFVDGLGRLIKGGGKVVKNAAGFDFPKLFTGSIGRLGMIVEASFKVFPKPQAVICASTSAATLADAVRRVIDLAARPFDLDAIELLPPNQVIIRIAGHQEALQARLDVIAQTVGGKFDVIDSLPPISANVRVPVTPPGIVALDDALARHDALRRYSVAGNVAWVAWPHEFDALHELLLRLGLSGQVIDAGGRSLASARIGLLTGAGFESIVKQALDPDQKFGSLPAFNT